MIGSSLGILSIGTKVGTVWKGTVWKVCVCVCERWMEPIIGFPGCLELDRCHFLLDCPRVKFYWHCDRIKTESCELKKKWNIYFYRDGKAVIVPVDWRCEFLGNHGILLFIVTLIIIITSFPHLSEIWMMILATIPKSDFSTKKNALPSWYQSVIYQFSGLSHLLC